MTLFKVPGERKIRAPKTPGSQTVKPVWTAYAPKTPVRCEHCVAVGLEGWQTGAPYTPAAQARQKRKAGEEILLLCNDHARIQKEADIDARKGQEHVRFKRSTGRGRVGSGGGARPPRAGGGGAR